MVSNLLQTQTGRKPRWIYMTEPGQPRRPSCPGTSLRSASHTHTSDCFHEQQATRVGKEQVQASTRP